MAAPENLTCIFHEQDPLPAPRRTSDDLLSHIKGIVQWYPDAEPVAGYYIPRKYSPSREYEPVEFINNQWYGLFKHKISTTHLCTCANAAIPISNCLGIGYWDITEPQHPDYNFNSQAPINIDPPEDHDSTRSNSPTTQALPANPTHYSTPTPGLTIASIFVHRCLAVRGVGRAPCPVKKWVWHGARQIILGGLDMVLLLGVRHVVCSRGE